MAGPASLQQYGTPIVLRGSYTHTVGAASETFTIGSALPIAVFINHNSTSEKVDMVPARFSFALSGKVRTVTIHDQSTVAAGEIVIIAIS